MLIMPYSHDQPDNARRMRRLKVARIIQKRYFTPIRVAKKIVRLLEDPIYARRAEQIALRIKTENGIKTACDALEQLASRKKTGSTNPLRLSGTESHAN
jgi:UDP:flavonoid glycosyltransferase YjiC (YdhE family)